MEFFVDEQSIVRKIWGNSDTILFIFAGAAAEFALNKAVDWLYFTGRLPADPLGRLFSTVTYARLIVFSEKDKAYKVIDNMYNIHAAVEEKRNMKIPDWAYRDVLFMLIDYSVRSYELLERKLTMQEKEDVYATFRCLGERMKLKNLPQTYNTWQPVRREHLEADMMYSKYTADLYKQYKKHLGFMRYFLLNRAQALVVPKQVYILLKPGYKGLLKPVIYIYKLFRFFNMHWLLKNIILPNAYKAQIKALDTN